ncbi:MAG: hypothetical protein JJ966_03090 [Balneolaceae bacterium]|jgi:hypothetical protein|nr:hypothetical protein [Balneolaceae bacterium]MCR9132458.1 hypothetical protein [bacterium]
MYTTIPQYFPNAVTIRELEDRIVRDFMDRHLELKSSIWATSLCSDEVSNMFPEFYHLFAGPGPFQLGGISGLPFTGVTGLKAFLSHVPTHGAAMILYGPHIGVSDDGRIGHVNRANQFASSTCCGSLHAALTALKEGKELPISNPLDYQQARVLNHLSQYRDEILSAENPLKKATDYAYEAIHKKVHDILEQVQDELEDIRLYLLGGIVINTDWNRYDYFEVHHQEFYEY